MTTLTAKQIRAVDRRIAEKGAEAGDALAVAFRRAREADIRVGIETSGVDTGLGLATLTDTYRGSV